MEEAHVAISTTVCSRYLPISSVSSPTSASYKADTLEFAVLSLQHPKRLPHQLLHLLPLKLLLQLHLLPLENVERMQKDSKRELLEDVLQILMSGLGLLLWFIKTDEVLVNTAGQLLSRTLMFLRLLIASNR